MSLADKFRIMYRPQHGICTQAEFPVFGQILFRPGESCLAVKGENRNLVEDGIFITPYLTDSYGFSLDSLYPVTLMKQNGDHTCYDRHQNDVSEKDFMLQGYLPAIFHIYSVSINMGIPCPKLTNSSY